jgi:hypothetical protein
VPGGQIMTKQLIIKLSNLDIPLGEKHSNLLRQGFDEANGFVCFLKKRVGKQPYFSTILHGVNLDDLSQIIFALFQEHPELVDLVSNWILRSIVYGTKAQVIEQRNGVK